MCCAVIIDVWVSPLSNTRCGCGKKLTPMGLPIRNIFTNRIKFGWKGMFRRRTISSSFLYAVSRLVPAARFIERFRTDLFYWGYLLEANGTGRNSRQHNITENWHSRRETRWEAKLLTHGWYRWSAWPKIGDVAASRWETQIRVPKRRGLRIPTNTSGLSN